MAEKWIQGAIKKPGALREKMGVKEGETIPKKEINAKISALKEESKGEKRLEAPKRMLLKQLVLARTLGEMNK